MPYTIRKNLPGRCHKSANSAIAGLPRRSRKSSRRRGLTLRIRSCGNSTSAMMRSQCSKPPSEKAMCESEPSANQPPASRTAAAMARQLSSLPLREWVNDELFSSNATSYLAAAAATAAISIGYLGLPKGNFTTYKKRHKPYAFTYSNMCYRY